MSSSWGWLAVSNITIDQLGDEIKKALESYSVSTRKALKKATDEVADQMVRDTKANAQVRTGTYKRHIATQVGEDTLLTYSRIWYVKKPEYRSTHLLDKGHMLRNGGRYQGNQHVTNAANRAKEMFERKLEEAIRDVGSEN